MYLQTQYIMHIYSRYIKNLISSREGKKEELADQSQKVECNQDKLCNTAYQELEEISQQNQYDELSCREIKAVAFEQNVIK